MSPMKSDETARNITDGAFNMTDSTLSDFERIDFATKTKREHQTTTDTLRADNATATFITQVNNFRQGSSTASSVNIQLDVGKKRKGKRLSTRQAKHTTSAPSTPSSHLHTPSVLKHQTPKEAEIIRTRCHPTLTCECDHMKREVMCLKITVAVLATILCMIAVKFGITKLKRYRRRNSQSTTESWQSVTPGVFDDRSEVTGSDDGRIAVTNYGYELSLSDQFINAVRVTSQSTQGLNAYPEHLRDTCAPITRVDTERSLMVSCPPSSTIQPCALRNDYTMLDEASSSLSQATDLPATSASSSKKRTCTLQSTVSSYQCSYLSLSESDLTTQAPPPSPPPCGVTSGSADELTLTESRPPTRGGDLRTSVYTDDQNKSLDDLYQECDDTYMTHAVARRLCSVREPLPSSKPSISHSRSSQNTNEPPVPAACSTSTKSSPMVHPTKQQQSQLQTPPHSLPIGPAQSQPKSQPHSQYQSHLPSVRRPSTIELDTMTGTIQRAFAVVSDGDYHSFIPAAATPDQETVSDDFKVYTCDDVYFVSDDVTSEKSCDITSSREESADNDRFGSIPSYPAPGVNDTASGTDDTAHGIYFVSDADEIADAVTENQQTLNTLTLPHHTACENVYVVDDVYFLTSDNENQTALTTADPSKQSAERQRSMPCYVAPGAPLSQCQPSPSPRAHVNTDPFNDHIYSNHSTNASASPVDSVYLYGKHHI